MPDEIKDIGNLPLPVNIGDVAPLFSVQPIDKPIRKVQPAFVVELDRIVAGLPLDLEEWSMQMAKIEELGDHLVSEGDKALFSRHLIDAVLDKVIGDTDQARAHPLITFAIVQKIAAVAAKTDKMSAQEAAVQRQNSHKTTFEYDLAGAILRHPEMSSDDADIKIVDGDMQFRYLNKTILIKPPIIEAFKARELLLGNALLLEDKDGRALCIISPGMEGDLSKEAYIAKAYESVTAYADAAYYGEAASLEDIKTCLDDTQFQARLSDEHLLNQKINLSVLPLFGRVRLRNMLENPNTASLAEKIIGNLGIEGLSFFQILDEKHLPAVLEMIDYLGEKVDHRWARLIASDVNLIGEFAHSSDRDIKSPTVASLLEDKLGQQLFEAAELHKNDTKTDWDWKVTAHSFDALAKTAIASAFIAAGREFPLKDKLHPRLIIELYEFSARHPKAKTVFQSFYDFVLAYNIIVQRKAPYYGKIQEMKKQFYDEYLAMNQNVETTESETDTARTVGLVGSWYKEKARPGKPRMLVCGCGNTQRFESHVIRRLRDNGVEFSDILGVDLNDYKDQIPKDLNMRFLQGDVFTDEKMTAEGQFDVVLLPWSMINDIVVKDGLAVALQKIKKLVKKDGIVILDVPVPIGRHSYESTIEEQADLWGIWGIMERDFENGPQKIRSIFDIMHTRGLFMDCAQAGFLPDNFPWEFDRQQELCEKISGDDSFLAANHQAQLDLDAGANPIYQVKDYNRLTWALRNYGEDGVQDRIGLTPSVLLTQMFSV